MQNIESGNNLYSLTGYFYTPVWGYLLGAQDLLLNCFLSITYGARFIDLAGVEALTFIFHTSTVTTVEYNVVMKLPLICVDLLVGYLIYHLVLSETNDKYKSSVAFGCWFLCPIVIYMSAVQVQFDCVSALLALLCVLFLKRGCYFRAGVFFALGSLLKFFPIFCIFLFGIYALKVCSDSRTGIKQLLSLIVGALLTVFIIYLPLILSGSVIDSLSFIIDRSSNNNLYTTVRLWAPGVLLLYLVVVLAIKTNRMISADIKNNVCLLVLLLLCAATMCSSGPQYCIVYLPLLFVYATVNSRRDLLTCTVIFTTLATIAAFLNNNLSLVSSLVEYGGFWNAPGLVNAMQLVDSLTFGIEIRSGLSIVVESLQLLFNLIMLMLLCRGIGLFDKHNRLYQLSTKLSIILGGGAVEEK